jgi:16S rRNA (cytidine1402-2'-O)-methyltransferase
MVSAAPDPMQERARIGRLFLVPAPLDFGCREQSALQEQMPAATLATAARLGHWVCENAKSLRAYLGRVHAVFPLAAPLQSLQIAELPREAHKKGDHLGGFDATPLLAAARAGHDIGLASEAGMPAIADPGSSVVRAAHSLGIVVVPLVGPVSLMLALAASGLNGQNFAFVGYLPSDAPGRSQRARDLEALACRTGQTQLFIETPYRNAAMMQTLLQTLAAGTRLAVSSGLTTATARTFSATVAQWRKQGLDQGPDNATPAVFGIGP